MCPKKNQVDHPEDKCAVRCIHLDRVKKARDQSPDNADVDRLARTFGALGDPTRLKMLLALSGGEMCVCDLAAFLGVTESAVSHQLRRLRDLALVRRRREGQVLYYALDDAHVDQLLKIGASHIKE